MGSGFAESDAPGQRMHKGKYLHFADICGKPAKLTECFRRIVGGIDERGKTTIRLFALLCRCYSVSALGSL